MAAALQFAVASAAFNALELSLSRNCALIYALTFSKLNGHLWPFSIIYRY
jgi:hypothetical protein